MTKTANPDILVRSFYKAVSNLINFKAQSIQHRYGAQLLLEHVVGVLAECLKAQQTQEETTVSQVQEAYLVQQRALNERIGGTKLDAKFANDLTEIMLLCSSFFLSTAMFGEAALDLKEMHDALAAAI